MKTTSIAAQPGPLPRALRPTFLAALLPVLFLLLTIHFVPGADAFTIANYSASMFFEGAGVTNDSGVTQNFTTTGASGESTYYFDGTSTAGTLTAYTMQGGSPGNSGNYGIVYFNDQSSAASGTFTLLGGNQTNRFGGEAFCSSTSTLDHA